MTQRKQQPTTSDKNTNIPRDDKADKETLKHKAEQQEVAGKHKNDGQMGHKARR